MSHLLQSKEHGQQPKTAEGAPPNSIGWQKR